MKKELMLQALNELDRIFYNQLRDEFKTLAERTKAEQEFDFFYEKLERMIKTMED